jgi:hypothetical protein
MNEPLIPSQIPPPTSSGDIPIREIRLPSQRLSNWVKRFLACNPFYLVSAALLLYGFYRVSVDPDFLRHETAQLLFNFSSLQGYEILLVVTAIFLARRRIWYDSTLLVGLENLLVLVPFILISQAALIDSRMVWTMCLAGGILALGRSGGLRRFVGELNFPSRLAVLGLVVLACNIALPVVYRILHEYKFGTKPDWGAAYQTNQYVWWLMLPALCALENLLPRPRPSGELLPQRGWLPVGLFSLWMVGTIVHLYCLGYVYDFSLRADLVAPALWVLMWTLQSRGTALVEQSSPLWKDALLVPPLLAPLVATAQPGNGNRVFLLLTLLNALIYGGIRLYHRDHRLALHLVFISLVALIGGLPEDWGRSVVAEFSRAKCVGAGAAAYFLLCAALSRNPKLGLLGAVVAALVTGSLLGDGPNAIHWAAQAAMAFLLLHSLRWIDAEHQGASALRVIAGLIWAGQAFLWMHTGGAAWMTWVVAGPVLGGYLLARWLAGRWSSWAVPAATVLVMLSGPGNSTAGTLHAAPVGLLAIIGSFLLLGLGTLAALTKHVWNKTE